MIVEICSMGDALATAIITRTGSWGLRQADKAARQSICLGRDARVILSAVTAKKRRPANK